MRPNRRAAARRHPAMGAFKHEAAVDPRERRIYLTEDLKDGLLYRLPPSAGRAWNAARSRRPWCAPAGP